MAYTANFCFSQFWRPEVQEQGTSTVRFLVKALFLVAAFFSLYLDMIGKEGANSHLLIKTLIPSWKPHPHVLLALQNLPIPKTL